MYRDHNCGELTIKDVGQTVQLAGWVQTIRNLGSMQFVDLRDQFGITQIVISEDMKSAMNEVYQESVISVTGKVLERSNKNLKIPTGEIEIKAEKIEILGKSKNVLPFEINSEKADISNVREDLRLQYRYLDLRNDKIHNSLLLRAKIIKDLRDKMVELGFPEIQTPILANSSPEGARDYIVPSRLHPGEFYALPQAPQQFKQLLMISGFDKYYQIAPCFRDEDPRADRAPGEFYQLDMEMSFATQEDVFKVIEEVIPEVFRKNSNWKVVDTPFIRIPYAEAMEKYGIDKPDLRNPLIIKDATHCFKHTEFNAFKDKTIKYIIVPDGAKQGRKFFDEMGEFAKTEADAAGLAWVKVDEENNLTGGIAKFLTDEIKTELGAKIGDTVFFIADEFHKAQKIAGLVRIELGKRLDLIEKNIFKFCWIVDFPMYEYNEDEDKIDFNHNPFSMPQGELEALNTMNPLDILAYQYDLVCNGYELASGAVRNHNPEVMVKAFEIAGYTEEDVKNRFGALYTAFQYGTPPHAGCAPGLDRMVMLIADTINIREVIAFPKNKKARDLMMNAPSVVTEKQLEDVHIKVTE
ncbi:MAG: aspartate--tRNA ligase [Clostridiales bacterium]|nr:aspartate--tRNA ligase [Clostridiales bacterium]